MLASTSTNPAIQAYKVYHLSQTKLDRECRRQTPDLHRIVLHASIVDNVRRWSRDLATPSETVVVDSESDTDSDPFEDSASDEEYEDAMSVDDQVAIFDCEVDDDTTIEQQSQTNPKVYAVQTGVVPPVETKDAPSNSAPASPRRRAPPPPSAANSTYELNGQSWKQNRPVTVRETAIEVDGDD
ncbi:uncharacterized protein PV07_00411 [Cladophialophora immunda]|uniref:Uncharacterized protein n=1 Tax=Cladophialophora immunda TaxID=569365 RepID=A0A0D2B7M5_9EURO|nr:uncharacterized protein PV07_00411 [Cladophialophora immunda]KIW33572.1 hypothetical protein PV07_00411 [Cladophialophora immunda]OQV04256.1 hypothetical protein CLAIMM_09167 [Cladophialophora immunda]